MFEKISIWGRIAYAICCFENYILKAGYERKPWGSVFQKLWAIDNAEYVDDWLYSMIEYIPECILEFENYGSGWEYIDENTFNSLYRLYSDTPRISDINLIMTVIKEICESEIYSPQSPPAASSLRVMEERLLPAATALDIDLPDIKYFQGFAMSATNCWGEKLRREMVHLPYLF